MYSLEDHELRIREQGGELEYQTAQASVLLCAISALVETHPEPAAPDGSKSAEGMDDALAVLEKSCLVPLNVRPPGVAAKPLGK